MEIQITQRYEPETWDNVKEHFSTEELDLALVQEDQDGGALLIWIFRPDKTDARKLAVMLEMIAGLGNPQGGLDMKPSKRELFK
jgi:hypothetical protein